MLRAVACLIALSTLAGPVFVVRADEPAKPSPLAVRVQAVSFNPAQGSVIYPGIVQPRVQVDLGFRIGGKVIERRVDIGDHVAAGQVLARLDPLDTRLSLEANAQVVRAAQAEALNARADFQRYQRMGRGSPAFLPSEFDKRQAAFDSAEAKLAQAQRQVALAGDQLDYTSLTADADGVITDLKLEVGQVVPVGQTVFTLAHTAETEIAVDVPENHLSDIRAGDIVSIWLWSQPDKALAGRVREIGALADAVSRTFVVKIAILGPPSDALSLGMTASVRFVRAISDSIARLPASSIVSVDGMPSVWVLDPVAHRAIAHQVKIASWLGDGDVAISAGVDNGMQVVTAGATLLDSNTPVTAWAGAIR
jgi:multidrug efflux system membrane fusion protein